jgi:uncharacterized protein (DUF2141 family)
MSRLRLWLLCVAAATVLALVSSDAPAARAQNTARLTGTVRDQDGAAVRLAIVTLDGEALSSPRSRISDDQGRFAFESLPAGRFTLSAEKAAYVTSEWGARRAGRPGTTLTLAEGEPRLDVELRLPRGGVITGILRDTSGRAVPNAEVAAIPTRTRMTATSPTIERVEGVLTDDQGMFRIFGLAPDEYHVIAGMNYAGSGPVGAMTPSEIDRVLAAAGNGASAAAEAPAPDELPARAAVITYYPGTGVRGNAVAVPVDVGEVRDGVDFAIVLEPAAVVSGSVAAPPGVDLSSISVSITADEAPPLLSLSFLDYAINTPKPGPDGAFRIPGVPPGRYQLMARATVGSRRLLWAYTDLSVNGEDISGVLLTLQPGIRVGGRAVFAGATELPTPLTSFRLILRSELAAPVGSLGLPVNMGMRASILSDGRFAFAELIPGLYELAVTTPDDSAWWLRSAMLNGRDVLDYGLQVDEATDDLVVTFTRQDTKLSGTLTAGPGIPAPGYVIVTFPADPEMWRPQSRRIRATRPADDGTYAFERLPAGEYRVAALTDIDEGEWNAPAFLGQLLPASQPVTVAEGGVTTFDIRIAG